MKNKYKIGIALLLIFIVVICIFLYSKSLNNKSVLDKDDKLIGIYLQNEYGGDAYTWTNSFPEKGYKFNTEKTNELCDGATFTYDEDSDSIIVNSTQSIKCNYYFDIDVEQLVHYQFLYDGSLGDIEANEMKEITGGLDSGCNEIISQGKYYSICVIANKYNNHLEHEWTSDPKVPVIAAMTNNTIDLSNYNNVYLKLDFKRTSSQSNYAPRVLISTTDDFDFKTVVDQYMGSSSISISDLYSINYNGKTKFGITAIDSWENSYTTFGISIYEIALIIADDYNELAKVAGLANVSKISDIVNNSNNVNTILNNEEAVKYMIYNCTGDFMVSAIQSNTFMNAYKNSKYKSMIDKNPHWAKFMAIMQ